MSFCVDKLCCVRGNTTILSDVSFELATGDCLILRGPNGIGKSTLLNTLAGLAPQGHGTSTLDPDDIAYSGHLDAIKFQLTVAENLQFWAGVYGTNTVASVMQGFGLTELANRPAGNLSAGQKRRVGLARLLVSDRKVWLMDEPTTSLDADHTALITKMIDDHCQSGGIAVLSTHIDLDIKNAQTLELSQFKPEQARNNDVFLEGSF
ncbi:heme ABC exporter ATP-binding protein CcmA [Amylibacter sp. SFDW26]|uniref:heme ABC exporter ATP-binding protein CcmA n=1 Tax=Amylibacter sp. SFDW26 TaxID=2652722 RepID=UPI00126273A7|nr:heme ABC exporter ATP-binding protein CcmA [Amylibacter sp. SFDW26]KAB7615305.1 heme ABC exporter ATP-binding protein CcmA [Amylibacter sp. SFDW26]